MSAILKTMNSATSSSQSFNILKFNTIILSRFRIGNLEYESRNPIYYLSDCLLKILFCEKFEFSFQILKMTKKRTYISSENGQMNIDI